MMRISFWSAKPASRPNGIIDTPFIIFISRLLLSDILKLSLIIAKQTETVIKTFLSAVYIYASVPCRALADRKRPELLALVFFFRTYFVSCGNPSNNID
jgi:hypothetical protein